MNKQKMIEYLVEGYEVNTEFQVPGRLFDYIHSLRFQEDLTNDFNQFSGLNVSVSEAQQLHQEVSNMESIEYGVIENPLGFSK